MKTNTQCVVLLHGLGRTRRSMSKIETALNRAGYVVINLGYRSRSDKIENLALNAISSALHQCLKHQPEQIHFVTHSMGGILLRYFLQRYAVEKLGNTVMLCPPNHGSEVADKLRNFPPFRWLNGPAGLQLVTGQKGIPSQLGAVDYPVGIIAGNQFSVFDRIFHSLFSGDHDGKVSVQSARLEGMKDFLVVRENHTFILNSETVIMHILNFLQRQSFGH